MRFKRSTVAQRDHHSNGKIIATRSQVPASYLNRLDSSARTVLVATAYESTLQKRRRGSLIFKLRRLCTAVDLVESRSGSSVACVHAHAPLESIVERHAEWGRRTADAQRRVWQRAEWLRRRLERMRVERVRLQRMRVDVANASSTLCCERGRGTGSGIYSGG